MTRKKVKFAFIENATQRKASYSKRQKGFLKKAYELSTICNVEMSIVVYSPYHDEPKVFPNHDDAINTFTKFSELSALNKSKSMVTHEEFTKQRITKMEEQLRKVKKKNRIEELANKMYEVLNDKDIPTDIHLYDLNDLSYVINQNLKQIHEAIKTKVKGEGSTSNAPQPTAGLMVPSRTNSEWPSIPLLALQEPTVSMFPLVDSSPILDASTSMVPPTAPSMVPSAASSQVLQPMFHLVAPLMTLPQTVPLVGPSWVSPSPHLPFAFSSQIFPPMVSQMYPPLPLQIDLRRPPRVAHSIPSTTIASPVPSLMMDRPMFPSTTSQVDPSINIPQMSTSIPMNTYQNYFVDFPQSPALSEIFDWNNDDIMTLFDDSF